MSSKKCKKCGYEFTRVESFMCCGGCNGPRCNGCDPECKKPQCSVSLCSNEKCTKKTRFPGFCHTCNTKCWMCGYIPYPPCPKDMKYIAFGNVTAVICPRRWHWSDKHQINVMVLSKQMSKSTNVTEDKVKSELARLAKIQ